MCCGAIEVAEVDAVGELAAEHAERTAS